MNNQTFVIACVLLCSLGGWYVVITKYWALKKMIEEEYIHEDDEQQDHIPGMGPPPVGHYSHVSYSAHEDSLHIPNSYAPIRPQPALHAAQAAATPLSASQHAAPMSKREAGNYACMMHLTGFALIFAVPLLNVLLPLFFWLWHKERHPYIDKQGREVVNFQITFTIIQMLCLVAGAIFIRYMPASAEKLFNFAKITKIVFASGMHLPFNIFTMLPFIWCCLLMIRGSVAAYNCLAYKYPLTQQFLFVGKSQGSKAVHQQEPIEAPGLRANINFS